MYRFLLTCFAFGAASLLLIGGLTTSFWASTVEGSGASIGLGAIRQCTAAGCLQTGLEAFATSPGWVRAGAASYAAALMAGGLLLALAVTAATGTVRRLLVRTTCVALACAGVCALIFIGLAPELVNMRPGYSMIAYFAGMAAALVAVLMARAQVVAPAPAAAP